MKSLLVSVVAMASLGCGPTGKKQSHPGPESAALVQADADTSDGSGKTVHALNEDDCEVLFAHVFEVAFTSQRASLPVDERPTDEDLRKAKDALRTEIFGQCVGATREAFQYDCAIAAMTREDMQRCMGAE